MRISDQQIRRLADRVLADLIDKGGASLKAERGRVRVRIEEIVRRNLAEELDLDRDARKLLEAHLAQAPAGVDRQKLFLMIKKRLAEERDIPL